MRTLSSYSYLRNSSQRHDIRRRLHGTKFTDASHCTASLSVYALGVSHHAAVSGSLSSRGLDVLRNPITTVPHHCDARTYQDATHFHGESFISIQYVAVVSYFDDHTMVTKQACNGSAGNEPAGCRRHVTSPRGQQVSYQQGARGRCSGVHNRTRGGVLDDHAADFVSKCRSSERR